MNRTDKEDLVSTLRHDLEQAAMVLLVGHERLSVAEASALRAELRRHGARLRLVKNTLARRAVKETPIEKLIDTFSGPTMITVADDPVACAKIICEHANRDKKITVKSGFSDGQVLDKHSINAIAALPPLDELRARLVGVIKAPASKLARLSSTPSTQLARLLSLKPSAKPS